MSGREPLSLGQVVSLLQGLLDAGADPSLPVGVHVGDTTDFVDQVCVTDDEAFDVWIGATSDE